jgi:predicted nucleotidyltransferase
MAKIQKPEDIFPDIIEDFKNIFAEKLTSIILYGSGARDDYQPGKSDLNFLVILSEDAIDHLDQALDTVSRWRKKNVAVPLFMTKSYITSSLDSFPIEFLNIKESYILAFGEDVLKDISFDARYLRLQCEREIKGKLLLLRESFLETEGKQKRVKELIKASVTAFISIFSGILYLKGIEIPTTRRNIIQAIAGVIPIESEVFMKCLDIKEDKKEFSSAETMGIFKEYLMQIRKLWEFIDQMEL